MPKIISRKLREGDNNRWKIEIDEPPPDFVDLSGVPDLPEFQLWQVLLQMLKVLHQINKLKLNCTHCILFNICQMYFGLPKSPDWERLNLIIYSHDYYLQLFEKGFAPKRLQGFDPKEYLIVNQLAQLEKWIADDDEYIDSEDVKLCIAPELHGRKLANPNNEQAPAAQDPYYLEQVW